MFPFARAGVRSRLLPGFLLVVAAVAQAVQPAPHVVVAGRDVAYWKPSGAPRAEGYPLVLFSHGFGGCNTQSIFLMEALAQAGYLVVAPNHKDASCGSARERTGGWYPGKIVSGKRRRPEKPFRSPADWNDATYRDRAADIETILDVITREKSFQGIPVDLNRIGIGGHSLGGYTALGLAGAWPSWKDRRIKAVLALSPFCSPYVTKGDLRHMNVPVMYQGGTRDIGITSVVQRRDGAYDVSSAPKVFVEFDGAGHFAWTNLKKDYQGLINSYAVAFLDRYLRGKTDPDPLVRLTANPPPKGVAYVKFDGKEVETLQ